jgi:hypothetical protein
MKKHLTVENNDKDLNRALPVFLPGLLLAMALCAPALAAVESPARTSDNDFARTLTAVGGFSAGTPSPVVFRDSAANTPSFKKVMIIVLENISYKDALAQPFLSDFARQGALLTNFDAETHPSQGNYIALTAGSFNGVTSDKPVNLNVSHIGDLLEAKSKTWKVYAQAYPGNCFLGAQAGTYVRKHVPFLSFVNIQKNPQRCANIVDDSGLAADISGGRLPDFSLFIPDIKNDGHDTGVAYADNWLSSYFGPLMQDPGFMKDMLLIITFDEDDKSTSTNQIYTALYGPAVAGGSVSASPYDHYSLLRTIEDTFGLGTLGKNDDTAAPITGIWK